MVYLTCIIAYLLLLAVIAIWKSKDVKDQSDFAVAGRSLSPWMMVCTMLAVWIGTGSIVGNAEQTYDTGMAAMLLPLGTLAGMALLSMIASRARNVAASSVPEILELSFGPTARNLAMISLVMAYMVIVSYQFNAGGAVLEVIAGDQPPVELKVGAELTRGQLVKGRLRYYADADRVAQTRLVVVGSESGKEITVSIGPPDDHGEAAPGEDATALRVNPGTNNRVKIGAERAGDAKYSIQELPELGQVKLVEPIITAKTATIIAASFIIVYASMAGLMSLAWMDLVTGSIIMLTMVISFPVYWFKAGGWEGLEAGFIADNRASHLQLLGIYSTTQLINYILPVFLLILGDANQYQRIFASRNAKGARTAVIMMVFIGFAVELLIIACAWLASSMTPDEDNGKYILIYAARHFLSLPLGCLFMVTVVAIIISTADSFLHVPAATVVNDLYLKYINPAATQKQILAVSRILVVVFGIIAYVVSLLFSESTGFFEKALYAFTIYGASITPSLVAALVWPRATRAGAVTSICTGAIVTLIWSEFEGLRKSLPESLRDLDAVLPALILSVTMLVVISLLTRPSSDSEKRAAPQEEKSEDNLE